MNVIHLAEELDCELRAVGEKARAIGAKAYLKSDLEFIGDQTTQMNFLPNN